MDRFTAVAYKLGVKVDLLKEFDIILEEMRNNASLDYIASRGEYLNAMVIADYLGYDFVDSAGMVIFDERGKFLPEETNEAIAKELEMHPCAVIPGFYGAGPVSYTHLTLPTKRIV